MSVQKLLCAFRSVLDTDLSFIFKEKIIQNCAPKNSNRDLIILLPIFCIFLLQTMASICGQQTPVSSSTILEIHKINS